MSKLQLIAAASAQLYAHDQLAGVLLTRAHSTSSTTSAASNTSFTGMGHAKQTVSAPQQPQLHIGLQKLEMFAVIPPVAVVRPRMLVRAPLHVV
jgi:hypothetical protein